MSQLTITLDDNLLMAAQAFAQRKGQQLDALVADLLRAEVQPTPAPKPLAQHYSPRIQRLLGSLKLPADFDYRTELENALEERFGSRA